MSWLGHSPKKCESYLSILIYKLYEWRDFKTHLYGICQ